MGRTSVAWCRKCRQDSQHKIGRRGRWHCLGCGTENLSLRASAKARGGLPPGFLVDRQSDGRFNLYMAVRVPLKGGHEQRVMHYLKAVLPSYATSHEIEGRAWEVYLGREGAPEHA